jgi:hypothetical protein
MGHVLILIFFVEILAFCCVQAFAFPYTPIRSSHFCIAIAAALQPDWHEPYKASYYNHWRKPIASQQM